MACVYANMSHYLEIFFFSFVWGGGRVQTSTAWSTVAKLLILVKKDCAAGVNVWRFRRQHLACTHVNYGSVLIFAKLCCVFCNDWVVNEWMIVPMIKYCGRHFHWSLWNVWFLWLLFLFHCGHFRFNKSYLNIKKMQNALQLAFNQWKHSGGTAKLHERMRSGTKDF